MRNNNADIVIHHLINRNANRAKVKHFNLGYLEEIAIKEREKEKISIMQEDQLGIEAKGHWKRILFDHLSFTILIKEGKNEQKVVDHFISKLRNRI